MQSAHASGETPLTILALGTSTDWCSVAVLVRDADGTRVRSFDERAGNGQSEVLLPMTTALLREVGGTLGDVDAFAFDAGPGAFTGLRIGCSVAQGLGFALDRPLVPVMSLEALALQAGAAHALVAIDARMREVYCGAFVGDVDPRAVEPVRVLGVDDAIAQLRAWHATAGDAARCVAIGDAFARHPALAAALQADGVRVEAASFPSAAAIARLAAARVGAGRTVAARDAAPVYVRDKVALNVDEQRALRAAKAGA